MRLFKNTNKTPPELKSTRELELMRASGRIVAGALAICRAMAKPGMKTIEIDLAVEAWYAQHEATPLFKGYPGTVPFPGCICASVNEQVVHGVPSERVLKDGDILSIDTACKKDGWCADRAICLPIGEVRPERLRMIKVGEETLQIAIDEMPKRRWWSEIASRMQKHVEQSGFKPVTDFVGHGIGRIMHENPQVPNYVNRETRKHDFRLQPGLVLAVEPMVNMRDGGVKTLGDEWTVVTKDGMPSVHVEHTLALTPDNRVMVITSEDEAGVWPQAR